VDVNEAGNDQIRDAGGVGGRLRELANLADLAVFDRDERPLADRSAHKRAAPQTLYGHTLILPRTVGRPPVAPEMLVLSPAMASFAMIASAMASFALPVDREILVRHDAHRWQPVRDHLHQRRIHRATTADDHLIDRPCGATKS
jgi:hypothetical protein